MGGRLVRSRDQVIAVLRGEPDAWSRQTASLGHMTNTISPGSRGRHDGRPGLFAGDPGYGVNRWAGRWPYELGTVQQIGQPAAPVLAPISSRTGLGAMSSGQPGLPQGGQQNGIAAVAWMSMTQLGERGMGS